MTARRRHYITTAIDYANGPPHIGHALEKIGADAMARYRRLRGDDVHFVIGMDEHGLKVLQSAEAAGISPEEWVDRIATAFLEKWDQLSISNTGFVRTSQPRHALAVTAMIERMKAAGDLYRGSYAGYYCVGCEAYKREEELVRSDGAALRCPNHPGRDVEWMEEENWFFRLSSYQERLLALLDERPGFVRPDARRNEIRRVIEDGLDDISVSRSRLPWGVPWPDEPDHTVYVWIDALTNYLSAIGFPDAEYRISWPADVHVIGKDITRFHCVYWPAMLMSAGLDLPGTVWAHGFLAYEGRKLSKSEGTWVELDDAMARFGPDPLRYYLLRDVPWNGDGDFSWGRFAEVYTADLANDLGNLVNRALTMIERYRDGVVPAARPTTLDERSAEAVSRYTAAMDDHLLHQGVAAALELAGHANSFVDTRAPWKQAREPERATELDDTLGALARTLAVLATLLEPFMPGKMRELAVALGLDGPVPLAELEDHDLSGRSVARGGVLFPRESA